MELAKWFESEYGNFIELPDDLHIVGNCGECKHMAHSRGATREHQICWNEQSLNHWSVVRDGCIHFEENRK